MATTIHRRLNPKLWDSADFQRLSPLAPSGQALWLYLLSTRRMSVIPGLILAGVLSIAEDTRWDPQTVDELLRELEANGLAVVDRQARIVWLPKAHVQPENKPRNGKSIKAWSKAWDQTPRCVLKQRIWESLRRYTEQLAGGWLASFKEACPDPGLVISGEVVNDTSPQNGSATRGLVSDTSPHDVDTTQVSQDQDQEQEQVQEQEQDQVIDQPDAQSAPLLLSVTPSGPPDRLTERVRPFIDAWNRGAKNNVSQAGPPGRGSEKRDRAVLKAAKRYPDPADWQGAAEALSASRWHGHEWDGADLPWVLKDKRSDANWTRLETWVLKGRDLREGRSRAGPVNETERKRAERMNNADQASAMLAQMGVKN